MINISKNKQNKHSDAKKMLIKSKLYKVTAYLFAFVGLMVFVSLYMKYINGEAMNFIHNPILVLILFAPFIPSITLLFMAKGSRKKARELYTKAKSDNFNTKQAANLGTAKQV